MSQMVLIINLIMLSNPGNIQNLITKLLIDRRFEKAIENGLRKYQIKQFKIDALTPNQIFSMHYVLTTKFYYNKPAENTDSWYENELRLFIWLLVGYSYLQEKCVSKMTFQDWHFFSEIFNNRSPQIFQFQALSILKKEIKFTKWTSQEINLLDSIIKSKKIKNKWNEIAKELFILSNKKFFRTAKQCRQHWINHLDPIPIRSQWETKQDLQLVKAVKCIGKKWAKVSKKLNGRRTEHMVKNRFKSLYQFEMKRCKQQYHRNLSQQQIILQMERRLTSLAQAQKRKQSERNQKYLLGVSKELDQEFQSAEDQIKVQNIEIGKVNQQNCFVQFEEGINSEDDQDQKLPAIYQTLESIEDNDEEYKLCKKKSQNASQDYNNFFYEQFTFN